MSADRTGDEGSTLSQSKASRYEAFISYSHADESVANWLHRKLENYLIPKELAAGRPRRRIGKVFRDRVELATSHDLGSDIRAALDRSDALILLCSPRSAKSQYVAEEICRFKQTGKGDRIFAVIVGGEPHAAGKPGGSADDECFPRALLYQVDPDGTILDKPEPAEPLAADFREGKDGREGGSLKIIAGLLRVGLDELVKREKRAARMRQLRANLIAGAMAVLALGALGAGVVAWQQRGLAEAREVEAQKQTASAMELLSNNIAREAKAIFDQESGDHTASLLMALYADPAAKRSAIGPIYAPAEGYAFARARMSASYLRNRLKLVLDEQLGGAHSGALAYSTDGKYVVTGSSAETLRVRDASTARPVATLTGHTGHVTSAAFSPDGRTIITGSHDNTARIWDAATGQLGRTLEGHSDDVLSVTFSPDGRFILTGSADRTARVWDGNTGITLRILKGHARGITSVAYSPSLGNDGQQIAVTGSYDNTARIWDAVTGAELRTLEGHGPTLRPIYGNRVEAAFSPDGRLVVTSAYDGTARIWDALTGETLHSLDGHGGLVLFATFSLDGRFVLTGSDDGTVRIWEAESGEVTLALAGRGLTASSVAFSQSLAENCEHCVIAGYVEGVARVWETAAVSALDAIAAIPGWSSSAYSGDGRALGAASEDGAVGILDVATGDTLLTLGGHRGRVLSAAFSADGKLVATGSGDRSVRIWDSATGKLIVELQGHEGDVSSVVFSPDGRLVASGSSDGTARIWDVLDGAVLRTLEVHTDSVLSGAFSPDSRFLVTGSADRTARVWDTKTGTLMLTLEGNEGGVWSTVFSDDGTSISTASGNTIVRRWAMPDFLLGDVETQVRKSCELLWIANVPLAFRRSDVTTYPVLEGQPIDPDYPDLFFSPCRDVLPSEAFIPATAPYAWAGSSRSKGD